MSKNDLESLIKSAKKEYYQNYKRKHPEKYKEAQKRFWEKKAKEKQNRN